MAKADIVIGQSTYDDIALVRFNTPTGGTADFYYEGFITDVRNVSTSFKLNKSFNINMDRPTDVRNMAIEIVLEV